MIRTVTARLRALRAEQGAGRFLLFLLVGVLNTAFGYGCFALLVWLGVHYSAAALISTVLDVLFNFRTIGRLVFRSRENRLLWRFVGVYGVVYVGNLLGLRLGLLVGLDPYLSGAILLLPLALSSYYLQSRFVFPAAGAQGLPGASGRRDAP